MQGAAAAQRFRLIDQLADQHPIVWLCRRLAVTRSVSPQIHQQLRAAGLRAKTSAAALLGWRHHLHPHHSRLALSGGVAPRGVLSKVDGSVQPPRRWLEFGRLHGGIAGAPGPEPGPGPAANGTGAAADGITSSMSGKGCCWDNAVLESLFSTLQHELNLDGDTESRIAPKQLQRDLAFWIDGYYNRERRHSTLSYLSLIDDEQQFVATHTLTYAIT